MIAIYTCNPHSSKFAKPCCEPQVKVRFISAKVNNKHTNGILFDGDKNNGQVVFGLDTAIIL